MVCSSDEGGMDDEEAKRAHRKAMAAKPGIHQFHLPVEGAQNGVL